MKQKKLCMIAIVFIDIRRNYYVRISITELRRKLGIADPGICSDLCRLLVYFYQTTEKRAEKSSGYDLRNGSGRYRADDQRILRCYH